MFDNFRLAFMAVICLLMGGIIGRIFFPTPAPEEVPKPVDVATLLPNPLESKNEVLRFKLSLSESARFEKNHGLTSAFDNCDDKDGSVRCTAFKQDGTMITYHCDAERCVMDCER